ncbi:MAG: hypothetical protein U1E76_24475 [Planctomycetota bacterium]
MACHYMDLAFWALDLAHPVSVAADGPAPDVEVAPTWLTLAYEFPARQDLPAVKLHWYDGTTGVDRFAQTAGKSWNGWRNGVLFIGDQGELIADYTRHESRAHDPAATIAAPPPFIPESIGHHAEWIKACKEGGATSCGFAYAGPLTEAVLLGAVAYRSGQRIHWDGKAFKVTGAPTAEAMLTRDYRKGWEI